MMSPSFILAFAILLASSSLLLLWLCRNAILARLAPGHLQQDQEVPALAPAGPADVEAALGPSITAGAKGAPACVINKLPVFTYTPASRDKDVSNADQGNSCSSAGPVEVWGAGTTWTPLQVPNAAVQATLADGTADSEVPGAAAAADQLLRETGSSDQLQQEYQDQACTRQQQQEQHTSWIARLIAQRQQQQHFSTSELPISGVDGVHMPDDMGEQHQQQQQQQAELLGGGFKQHMEDTCIICLADYVLGDLLKQLPCKHIYHAQCVDKWLRRNCTCPLCKVSVCQSADGAVGAAGEARSDGMVAAVLNAARATNPAAAATAAGRVQIPHSARLTAHILAELQQQRHASSSRRSAFAGNSISRWDSMLSGRGS